MRFVRFAGCVLLVLAVCSPGLFASGFENTGLGATARGMGGAFRAVASDWSAAYYNPAGYAYIVDEHFGSSIGFVHLRNEITPDYRSTDYFGNGYEWGIANGQTIYNYHRILNNPAAGLVLRLPIWGETVVGLSAYQPFDYSIGWEFYSPEAADFLAYNDSVTEFPGSTYRNDLDVVAFQLTAAREFAEDRLSVGVGLQLLRADLLFDDLTLRSNPRPYPYNQRPRDRIPEFTKNEGRGWGFGLRAGLIYKVNEEFNVALTGYYPSEITIKGDAYFSYVLPLSNELLRDASISSIDRIFVGGGVLGLTSEFEAKMKLPPSAAVGLAYQLTEKLLVSVDAEYTLWSQFEGFEFKYSSFNGFKSDENPEDDHRAEEEFFTADLSNPVDWDNTIKAALGIKYDFVDAFSLMVGGSFDQSPSDGSSEVTPHFVDTGDKLGFNLGGALHINQYDLGLTVSYIDYPDLDLSGLTDVNEDDKFDNFPGAYKASTYETILSIGYRF
jgi:long-chain fatty acid transport protein